jgi:hypothetical protein
MPILYFPCTFIAVIAYVHFGFYLALIIVNIILKDAEPGQGLRTLLSRVFWARKLSIMQLCAL